MRIIDIFYQGQGLNDIEHLQLRDDKTFADLKAELIAAGHADNDTVLYIENENEPAETCGRLDDFDCRRGLRVHLARCRRVEVEVTFNGCTVERKFSPARTLARVKRWAAERGFNMTPDEAGEHALQIDGTHERPPLNTHIGALLTRGACKLDFDLVPDERING
ncbi:hypothetical protein [uncultured Tateyamaria sp.]|uniref:hypothetical protein n=1 Tax=uncultured Tateyamaria sp. TaxID=455651 RepID=UPI002608E085|nr:hypothetical protein [uncultured Tateyamaria sp.]